MTEITQDQLVDLISGGVAERFIDQSILDYPKIKKWVKSDEGDQFFRGEKGLVLYGGWEAVKIGTLIERWFIIKKTSGAVLYLSELCEQLKIWGGQDQEDRDPRISATSMFIKRFQEGTKAEYWKVEDHQFTPNCPCDPSELDLVTRFLENRFLKGNHLDIIHVSEKKLSWYSDGARDFINECFLWLEV